jgi:chromosome partitioning protein
MAVVITIAQQKGGAGKTMLAANLAAALSGTRRVALLDTDPQRSLTHWHALRTKHPGLPPIAFAEVSGWRLAGALEAFGRTHDTILVDSPPHVDMDARRAVRGADLVLVPVQPSAPDLWAAAGTFAMAAAERRRAVLVVNRAPTTPRLRVDALRLVRGAGHPVLPAVLGNRTVFAQAFAEGLGVIEAAPKTIAAREVKALVEAVAAALKR